jgi:hypothetical protein
MRKGLRRVCATVLTILPFAYGGASHALDAIRPALPVPPVSRLAQPSVPVPPGVTGGIMSPPAGDATLFQGINSAGTVRVNNLANMEALLNVVANILEVGGVGFGLWCIGQGCAQRRVSRVMLGIFLVIGGLAMPGLVNWLVSDARCAEFF